MPSATVFGVLRHLQRDDLAALQRVPDHLELHDLRVALGDRVQLVADAARLVVRAPHVEAGRRLLGGALRLRPALLVAPRLHVDALRAQLRDLGLRQHEVDLHPARGRPRVGNVVALPDEPAERLGADDARVEVERRRRAWAARARACRARREGEDGRAARTWRGPFSAWNPPSLKTHQPPRPVAWGGRSYRRIGPFTRRSPCAAGNARARERPTSRGATLRSARANLCPRSARVPDRDARRTRPRLLRRDDPDPVRTFKQWLAERNLGLVPIADAHSFDWAGQWIATVREDGGEHAVVMFGSAFRRLAGPERRAPRRRAHRGGLDVRRRSTCACRQTGRTVSLPPSEPWRPSCLPRKQRRHSRSSTAPRRFRDAASTATATPQEKERSVRPAAATSSRSSSPKSWTKLNCAGRTRAGTSSHAVCRSTVLLDGGSALEAPSASADVSRTRPPREARAARTLATTRPPRPAPCRHRLERSCPSRRRRRSARVVCGYAASYELGGARSGGEMLIDDRPHELDDLSDRQPVRIDHRVTDFLLERGSSRQLVLENPCKSSE